MTSQSNITKITLLQKKANRIISNAIYNAHTDPLLYANKMLPLDKIIIFCKLMFMHSVVSNYNPKSFSNT